MNQCAAQTTAALYVQVSVTTVNICVTYMMAGDVTM
jgi:hypothetical protein